MRKFTRAILVLLIVVSVFSTSVFAAGKPTSNTQNVTSSVSHLFVNFMDNAFSNPKEISITNSNGVDITSKYINKLTKFYSVKDYQSILQLIESDGLNVSYRSTQVDTNSQINPLAYQQETFNEYFYHIQMSSPAGYQKEWIDYVTGHATVNTVTGAITNAYCSVTFDWEYFGSAWSPCPTNISCRATINGSSIDFAVSYHLSATVPIELGIGPNFDFGGQYDSFTAYPNY